MYNGHWNYVHTLAGVPATSSALNGRPAASTGGVTYRHYQHGVAQTTFVLGEFPWAIQAGEQVDSAGGREHVQTEERAAGHDRHSA